MQNSENTKDAPSLPPPTEPKKLPLTHRHHGWNYTQVWRNENYAIYKQGGAAFELVRIQRHKRDIVWPNGQVTPAGSEYLPNDEMWGTHGWTFPTKEECKEKLKKLEAEEQEKAR